MKKFQTLEGLRGIAALLVVMYHLQDIFGTRAGIIPFQGLFGAGNRGVDLFFVLSGFIIMMTHEGDAGTRNQALPYIYKRLCRIFPAVWILTAIAAVAYGAGFGGMTKAAKLAPAEMMASALLLPQHGPALINVTWTLTYEIFFYGVFALLLIHYRIGILLMLAWQVGVALAAIGLFDPGYWLEGYYLEPICLEFGIGMACALVVARVLARPKTAPWHLLCVLALGASLFVGALLYEGLWDQQGLTKMRVLVYGVGAGAVIVALTLLEAGGHIRVPSSVVWLGSISFSVYLVHYSVITMAAVALLRLHLPAANAALLLSCGLLGVAAGGAFHGFVDKPIQTFLRRLGRRWFEYRGSQQSRYSAPASAMVYEPEN